MSNKVTIQCSKCDGKGYSSEGWLGESWCGYCKRTGKVVVELDPGEGIDLCTFCDGKGKWRNTLDGTLIGCGTCGGKGYV